MPWVYESDGADLSEYGLGYAEGIFAEACWIVTRRLFRQAMADPTNMLDRRVNAAVEGATAQATRDTLWCVFKECRALVCAVSDDTLIGPEGLLPAAVVRKYWKHGAIDEVNGFGWNRLVSDDSKAVVSVLIRETGHQRCVCSCSPTKRCP